MSLITWAAGHLDGLKTNVGRCLNEILLFKDGQCLGRCWGRCLHGVLLSMLGVLVDGAMISGFGHDVDQVGDLELDGARWMVVVAQIWIEICCARW
ncbi:hypothetical protein ACLOJK_022722, partial [Asimina triloba]